MKFVSGDIFESECEVLVNPVNCVGVMGAGLALKFKERYPAMFADYRSRCCAGIVGIGQPYLWRGVSRRILLFPTKHHWRGPSTLDSVEKGLKRFVDIYAAWKIESIAFPALGCGLGSLRWAEVKPVMARLLGGLPIEISVYKPR